MTTLNLQNTRFSINEKLKFRIPYLKLTTHTILMSSSYIFMLYLPEGRADERTLLTSDSLPPPHIKIPVITRFLLTFFSRSPPLPLSQQSLLLPWLRRLVTDLLSGRPGFNPRSGLVRSVVDKVTLGQVFLRVLRFFPVSIILQMFCNHLHLRVGFTRRTNGQNLGTSRKKKKDAISEIEKYKIEKYLHFFSSLESSQISASFLRVDNSAS
jgi:hypothetical protein